MTRDRDIVTIRYNILNLPNAIQFLNGNQIINQYAASRWLSDGRKLETEYFTMKLPLVTPICKDTVYKWTYSSGLVNQTGMIYIDNLECRLQAECCKIYFCCGCIIRKDMLTM